MQESPVFVSPDRLEKHVRILCEQCNPRDAFHPDRLDEAAAYIQEAFERAHGDAVEQPYTVNRTTYRNVIGRFGPVTAERIVVGAHYDVVEGSAGADDNASGVAALIELARLLGESSLSMQVELVAYTLEEPPFFYSSKMGSAVHAQSLKEADTTVHAMLALEMIGYFSNKPESQNFPTVLLKPFYPDRGNFIVVVTRWGQGSLARQVKRAMQSGITLPVHSFVGPRILPGVNFSDHLNYWKAGYKAAMITDTAFYRNPHYHTSRDTPETLDYGRMAQVAKGVYAAVLALQGA